MKKCEILTKSFRPDWKGGGFLMPHVAVYSCNDLAFQYQQSRCAIIHYVEKINSMVLYCMLLVLFLMVGRKTSISMTTVPSSYILLATNIHAKSCQKDAVFPVSVLALSTRSRFW